MARAAALLRAHRMRAVGSVGRRRPTSGSSRSSGIDIAMRTLRSARPSRARAERFGRWNGLGPRTRRTTSVACSWPSVASADRARLWSRLRRASSQGSPRSLANDVASAASACLRTSARSSAFSKAGAPFTALTPCTPATERQRSHHSGCQRSSFLAVNAPIVGREDSSPASVRELPSTAHKKRRTP